MPDKQTTKETRKQISFVVNAENKDLIELIDIIARRKKRSRNGLMNIILAEYVDANI